MMLSRKFFSIFAISFGITLLGCYQKNLVSPVIVQETNSPPPKGMICEPAVGRPTLCITATGDPRWLLSGSNNCHGYVKYALEHQLPGGQPPENINVGSGSGTDIWNSPNFIRVCLESQAQALFHLPNGIDHSVLVLSPGNFAYTTPSLNGYVRTTGYALNYSGACDYEYYAYLRDVSISAPYQNLGTYTFTLQNIPNVITQTNWVIPPKFQVVGTPTPSQLVIEPIPGQTVSGQTHTVSANLYTDATRGLCANGMRGALNYECANNSVPSRTTTFTILPDPVICTGTVDGTTLATVNSVTYGTHTIQMAGSAQLTWVRTSGSGSYTVSNQGRTVVLNLSTGGGTSFHVYGGGCDQNFTFYPHF